MNIITIVNKELGIPKNYLKIQSECRNDRAVAIVHRKWLISLLSGREIPSFICQENLAGDEIQAQLYQKENLPLQWHKILIQIVVFHGDKELVIPLPRPRVVHSTSDPELSLAQLLHYVSETNYKNLWKYFYKKYFSEHAQGKTKETARDNLSSKHKDVLQEVLVRYYGCGIITEKSGIGDYNLGSNKQTDFEPHANLLPALGVIQTKTGFLIIHHIQDFVTLKDCVTFSPSLLQTSYARPLFIIYQLLQLMKDSHDRGLVLGNLQLDDIFINDTLFIQVIPKLEDNIYKISSIEDEILEKPKPNARYLSERLKFVEGGVGNPSSSILGHAGLQSMCSKWAHGQISNFEYLMFLNRMAGRRFGDPTCHFIMPWVSDFSTKSKGIWRDLSKSKFRLNKGDRQLDLTYENAGNTSQTPHHVSEVLSEITYYVYLSRRTPRSLLCKHVRSVWVPAEYPSSIQRLQEWTPDECIPEFFYDPSIFKSIHEDLPDLDLPPWALTPEEFIEAHRESLESKHVSEKLHHWIDLTFGYKLSGSAAVKSKNVCLQLVDSHTKLTTSGVVQLFSYPHPQRQVHVPFFDKGPPNLLLSSNARKLKTQVSVLSEKSTIASEEEAHSSGNEEDDYFGAKSSPMVLPRLLSKSKGSLLAPFQSTSSEESTKSDQSKSSSSLNSQGSSSASSIILPKEYNPAGLLTAVEGVQNFFRKTFQTQPDAKLSGERHLRSNLKQVVASKRIQEMQILGCVIIEMFLQSKLRVVDTSDMEKRIKACASFSNNENLPRCVRSALRLLLQPAKETQNHPSVTSSGLPFPSAHQFLQPLLSSFLFPFPKLFPVIYKSICNLDFCTKAVNKYRLLSTDNNDFFDIVNESKVEKFSFDLGKVWDEILSTKNDQIIELLFPFIKKLFEDTSTSRLSVVLFLDKVTRCLGPKRTNELLLETILTFYESNSYDSVDNLYLYHKHFLLILIIRCGLKVFLENFVKPLVEAVGKYKDSSQKERGDVKSHSEVGDVYNDLEMTLSPLEEDSSPDVEKSKKETRNEREVEVFEFEKDDSSPPEGDEAVRHAMEHLDLNLPSDAEHYGQDEGDASPCSNHTEVRSQEINISGSKADNYFKRFTSIECVVGSKSVDSHTSVHSCGSKHQADTRNEEMPESLNCHREENDILHLQASNLAGDSLIWLAHRLGPVLTSRYLVRNLLRMLSLCYIGKDNLDPSIFTEADENHLWKLSIVKWKTVGDDNAENVLRVLGEIAELYGEQIIVLQYLPFMCDLVGLCKRKFTLSLEGSVIGCLSLLKYIVPFLNDTTLMDQLQDVILKSVIHPIVRLVSSTRMSFPSTYRGRYTMVTKLIDTMYLISLRIGSEMTKVHLAVPSLQRFFLAFDKAHGVAPVLVSEATGSAPRDVPVRSVEDNRFLEIQRDGSTTEWSVRGLPGQMISIAHVRSHESLDASPPVDLDQQDAIRAKALAELRGVFNAQLAYLCYLPFFRFLGEATMENTLKNPELIRDLCFQYEQVQSLHSQRDGEPAQSYLSDYLNAQNSILEKGGSGSFGSNVAVIGNKIELQSVDIPVPNSGINGVSDSEVVALLSKKIEDTSRHLRGNWLAYWEHEIGRSEKDNKFNFKQIKLQCYTGHGNSVRMIHCLDNENSFMSGSKDKTVKLWSLRSQGDGSTTSGCQYVYSYHRKSLLSLSFIHSLRLVASCDSTIHIWDPFEGKTISVLDNIKVAPISVLKPFNPPSCNLIAATTDATLKIIDARLCSFVSEYKVTWNPLGLIRSICVSPNGYWIAVGQASGLLTVLDVRTGTVFASWKGHEAEVLQLSAISDRSFLSSSLDQTVSVWNASDGKFKFHMKGPAEPVHCLTVYNSELITGTTANRIGVHTSIDSQSSFSSTKLRSDAFRGVLTSMTVLPLNKLLLLGADNGNITLLC